MTTSLVLYKILVSKSRCHSWPYIFCRCAILYLIAFLCNTSMNLKRRPKLCKHMKHLAWRHESQVANSFLLFITSIACIQTMIMLIEWKFSIVFLYSLILSYQLLLLSKVTVHAIATDNPHLAFYEWLLDNRTDGECKQKYKQNVNRGMTCDWNRRK